MLKTVQMFANWLIMVENLHIPEIVFLHDSPNSRLDHQNPAHGPEYYASCMNSNQYFGNDNATIVVEFLGVNQYSFLAPCRNI